MSPLSPGCYGIHVCFHGYTISIRTSHLTLALVGLLQMIKGRGGASGVEAAVTTSRTSELALFYIIQHGLVDKLQLCNGCHLLRHHFDRLLKSSKLFLVTVW